ncbi:MAG: DNA primase, partial [Bacteroidetes bacterium]
MPKITKHCVDQIYDHLDILDVLNDFVSLKKKGQNHWACCPFHNEKSASFSVSETKQIYKCFGCGAAGNAVGFVMAIQKISYPEALKYLANKYNINLEYEQYQTDEDQEAQTQRESVLIAMDFAKKHFKNLLKTHLEGISVGQAYFKERGFSPQTVEAFELGYSLPLWDNFLQTAQKEQFKTEILEQSGLILKNEQGKTYDRFRGRVMFPILDLAGKTIAFGARSLKKDEQPKYLNSPETSVYTKGEMLYGLYQARNEIRKKDNCYLTEGYTDVISMYQAGIQNVVASLGTSLTEKQIRLIKRFTENVTVLYDGDSSGIKASI